MYIPPNSTYNISTMALTIDDDHCDPNEQLCPPFIDPESVNRAMFVNAMLMLITCVFGFYGNLMSIAIFCHPSMKAPINVILTALSVIDTALIALSFPVFIMPGFLVMVRNETVEKFYQWVLLYCYPLNMMTHTCSIWTFVLVSIERYVAVCTPLMRHKLLTCGKAKLTQGAIVFSAICYNIIRFWEHQRAEDGGVEPFLRSEKTYFLYYFSLLYNVTHFLAPLSVILVLNMFVVRSLRAIARDQLRRASRTERQQRRTTQMIVLITLMFATCMILPFVLNVIEVYDGALSIDPILLMVGDVSNLLVTLNSSSTFIIYLIYCRKYRSLFVHYTWKIIFCAKPSARKNAWPSSTAANTELIERLNSTGPFVAGRRLTLNTQSSFPSPALNGDETARCYSVLSDRATYRFSRL